MKNIVVILGSRDPKGRTAQAASALTLGISGAGVPADSISLTGARIERCRQCEASGWGKCEREGRCVIEDDLDPILSRILEANAVVVATPVYYSDLSESVRAFFDRLRRLCAHQPQPRASLGGRPAVGICVAGGGGGGAPRCTVALERILLDCGFDVVDVVPVRRQNLSMKKQVLKCVGRWLTEIC